MTFRLFFLFAILNASSCNQIDVDSYDRSCVSDSECTAEAIAPNSCDIFAFNEAESERWLEEYNSLPRGDDVAICEPIRAPIDCIENLCVLPGGSCDDRQDLASCDFR